MRRLRKLASAHANLHDHFAAERNFINPQTYKNKTAREQFAFH